jgi:type VII secretion protein EccB
VSTPDSGSEPDYSNVVSAQHPPSMRLTTKVQVSGRWFLLRRLEHAIVRRNTDMWDDPGRFYSRAAFAGLAGVVIICLAGALLSWLKPQGTANGYQLLADTSTGEIFVLDPNSDVLRPVYNLTSARLIAGQPDNPRRVKPSELNRYRRTQTVGIPGAPYATAVNQTSSSHWSICDTATRPASTSSTVNVSVLADEPAQSPDTADPLATGQTAIVRFRGTTYLVDQAGRHSIDLTNTAITAAIELPPTAPTTIPISEALYNALTPANPIALPAIPVAGQPNTFGLDPAIRIGTVITDTTAADKHHYVVLADGLAKINPVTAAALRNTNSYGFTNPPTVPPDRIAAIPERVYASPLHPVNIVDRTSAPVLCWSWSKSFTDTAPPTISILSGKQIPVPAERLGAGIKQVTTAVTVYQHGGRFVQILGPTDKGENKFYISPTGVRFGVNDPDTQHALALRNPQPAPWPAIRLLAAGPDLTKQAALLEHDTLPNDPTPRAVNTGKKQ